MGRVPGPPNSWLAGGARATVRTILTRMIDPELATRLRAGGLRWRPMSGDRFTIPGGVTCQTCIAARCWQTIGQATCATCRLTNCNNNCVSQLVPCVTQNRCPTLVCP